VADITQSYIEIMNLVHAYPERIDAGDFAGVGELFAHGVIEMGPDVRAEGPDEVQAFFETWTRRYPDDGTPHTRHCVTNPIVSIDEHAGRATVRYYITVLQRTDDLPLQPVWANRYEDRLERVDGRWRFSHRRGFDHLPGDTRHHLMEAPPPSLD
jgi:SnoaL-like domain